MVRVVVLAGGSSDERDVSLKSGSMVAKALKESGYAVQEVDPKLGFLEILPLLKQADVVFPALHGLGGEDGTLQKQLEDQHIVYVGSGSIASDLCFYKFRYLELLKSHNINLPESQLVNFAEFKSSPLLSKPFVLKPDSGGSSIDVFLVRDPNNFKAEDYREVFSKYETLLLQRLILGVEITIGILNDRPLPVIEIVPPANQEFDYVNKYNGATQELCPPEHVSPEVQTAAQQLARQIHQLCGCIDMSRTDMIVDSNNQLFVLETNTIPGLTEQSLLPKAAKEAGITMPMLVNGLVKSALKRKN